MSTDSSSPCGSAEALRDYAFDELPADERRTMEQHLAVCGDCALELDQLRLTTAALRTLPDREIPQRIAFVSDKVFEPSPVARFCRFWNSAARLGFASACVLAVALVVSAWHRSPLFDRAPAPEVQRLSRRPLSQQVNRRRRQGGGAGSKPKMRAMIEGRLETPNGSTTQEYRKQMMAMEERYGSAAESGSAQSIELASIDIAAQRSTASETLLA